MAQDTRHQPKRALWFVSILFALVVCGAIVGATLTIQSAEKTMLRDVKNGLDAEVSSRTAVLTVWYGELQNQVKGFTRGDMFRLFASEMNALGDELPDFLRDVQEGNRLSNTEAQSLAPQLSLMSKILQDFVNSSNASSARSFSQNLHEYLFTDQRDEELTPEQQQTLKTVLKTGNRALAPVRMTAQGLVMDMVFPIFAPKYVSTDGKPVSLLLLSYNIMDKIREYTHMGGDRPGESTLIMQQVGTDLQDLRPDGSLNTLLDWKHTNGDLPLAIRKLDATLPPVYSLGVHVPGMPWTIVQTVIQDKAQSEFQTYRTLILSVASGGALICLLLLWLVWWWLVWKRERAISTEITVLYDTVSQQKQLLDGINKTFPVGLVLTDRSNIILYVNTSFTQMIGHSSGTLSGLSLSSMFDVHTTKILNKHLQDALQQCLMQPFTQELQLLGKKQHYQIVCAPFRDEDGVISGVVSAFQNITAVVEAQERSQQMVQQTISVLVRAIEAVDPYLRGQSTFTGTLAKNLVKALGLGATDEETVLIAANLFQIGMIQLPHTLLTKQGQLTPEEREQLERHVGYAREILSGMDFGMPVLESICQMYERLDGSGYPEHLKGDQIGIHGRILSVANSFCALMRPRSYRLAKSTSEALEILSVEPPRFDLRIVDQLRVFLETPEGNIFANKLQEKNYNTL